MDNVTIRSMTQTKRNTGKWRRMALMIFNDTGKTRRWENVFICEMRTARWRMLFASRIVEILFVAFQEGGWFDIVEEGGGERERE